MKIILSRKGFDSSTSGHPSPILPDGRMVSLPIPSSLDSLPYGELRVPSGKTYAEIIDELGVGQRIGAKSAHLDPDLVKSARNRRAGWCASFGQSGAAAGHLRNQDVGIGDLFLFYGWFRHTELINNRLRFADGTNGFHAIFGYLQVGDIIYANGEEHLPAWLRDHPHAEARRMAKSTNTIYIAAPTLNGRPERAGAGVFRFNDALVLTKSSHSRSRWGLEPSLFRHLTISNHTQAA